MTISITALLVHPEFSAMNTIIEVLRPEIEFTSWEHVTSIGSAFQELVEKDYTLCFIHGFFSDGLDLFFKDMRKAGTDQICSFIQLREDNAQDAECEDAIAMGFTAVISLNNPNACKEKVTYALEGELRRRQISLHVADLADTSKVVLKKVDNSVFEAQLGKDVKHSTLIPKYIETRAKFDESVLDSYVDSLIENAGPPAAEVRKIDIPQSIVNRELPFISKSGYSGSSVRVWRNLYKRFGVEAKGAEQQHLPETQKNEQSSES